MSDVPGDDVEKIAGSPTCFSTSDVFEICKKYNILREMKLFHHSKDPYPEADLLNDSKRFNFVDHHVIASISDALHEMAKAAFVSGLVPLKLISSCVNYVKIIGKEYAKLASWLILAAEGEIDKLELYNLMFDSPVLSLSEEKVREIFPSRFKWGLGLALLIGGQAMTKLPINNEHNGPNQELALYFSLYWYLRKKQYPVLRKYVVWFLGCNTTGYDGNSDCGGAYSYDSLVTGVYQEFNDLTMRYARACANYRNLLQKKADENEIEV